MILIKILYVLYFLFFNINSFASPTKDKYLPPKEEMRIKETIPVHSQLKNVFERKYVSLAFTSEQMNSPASLFGHIFFIFHNEKTPEPDSFAVSFYAKTSHHHSIIEYLANGLTGKYYGSFVMERFYKKKYEYLSVEQRFITTMRINLSHTERIRLQNFLDNNWDEKYPYYFFTENCASVAIDALDYAKNRIPNKSNLIPESMIYNRKSDFLTKSFFLPSGYRYLEQLSKMNPRERATVTNYYKNGMSPTNTSDKTRDTISNIHDWKFHHLKIRSKNYKTQFQPRYADYTYEEMDIYNPTNRTLSSMAGIGVSGSDIFLKLRPLKNDFSSYSSNLTLNEFQFLEPHIRLKDKKSISIYEFIILKLSSIKTTNEFSKIPSWNFTSGFTRLNSDQDLFYENRYKWGYAFGYNSTLLPQINIGHYSNYTKNMFFVGAGVSYFNVTLKKFKVSTIINYDYLFNTSFINHSLQAIYKMKNNFSLGLDLRKQNNNNISMLEVKYYF